ncbi:TonB-dependent receptor domain-containing protein [Lysobacter enzymogenes]|uniref:TonB-dependent receptor domain-containing protein n=2 Tax=Bacteria TaxID=2 RepID=UPI000894E4EC|nr:TonB-dependent receptor [Lysobacter enzymogenes]SDW66432.1 iron complex outermembrane recepter protein [Lysobacter enzymogenes]
MTFKTTKLRDAITFALAVGSTAIAGAAVAQEATAPAQQKATTLDRIEVTGSRIRQVDLETAQPVLAITRADIEKQGFQSVADILQNISATGAPAISRAQPLSAGENVGGQFISMRNLGATRTLILVNGKRLGISTSGLQDVSLIPTAAVERIEVLKDGASSIYGSDAIAGVVNIITRTNFEGATANAYYGQYSQGDGATTRADFVLGFTGDRGSLTAAVEYRKEEAVFSGDREFSAYPQGPMHPTRNWTTVSQWGVINLPTANGGNRVLNQGGDWRRLSNYHALNTNTGATAADPNGSTVDKSNTNLQTHLRTPLESRSLFVNGVFDITDKVRFRSDILYSQRDAERQVAGYPFQSASAGPIPGGFRMSKDSYYNPAGTQWGPGNGVTAQDVNFWRRTWEIPRVDKPTSTTWRFAAGLEGSFEVGERNFDWDVGYLYNNNKVTQENYGNLNIERTKQAVGPSFLNPTTGVVQCGTPTNPIPLTQCVPWNPFIPFGRTGDGGLTGNQALQDFLFQRLNSSGETETNVYSANLSGSLFALQGGDFGFAVGYEHRKEKGRFIPDAQAVTGNSTTLAGGPTNGTYSVDEFFVELAIPLLADLPGAKELSFSVASRYSDYSTFGDTVNNKFGFKWKPIDSLLFRGTYAEGFRAPTINDLYGGGSQTFSFFTDPCDSTFGAARGSAACSAVTPPGYRQVAQGGNAALGPNSQTPVAFFSGSNPNLIPETSKSRTLGVVWSPGFVEGLNASLDWWKIKIEDTIVADTPTQMLNDCYISGDASRCAGFTRGAVDPLNPLTGFVNSLTFSTINAGYREAEGYDLEVNYRLPTSIGNFALNWQTTYTAKDEIKTDTSKTGLPQQLVGYAMSPGFTGTFRIRSNASLSWEKGPFSATWGARYYSSQKETCLSLALFPSECDNPTFRAENSAQTRPINKLGSNTFHDLEFRVATPWNATVAVGANNVFDHVGPTLYSQPSANVSYQGQFDIGRFVYMKYQQRF